MANNNIPKAITKRAKQWAGRKAVRHRFGPMAAGAALIAEESYIKGWESAQSKLNKKQRYKWVIYVVKFGLLQFNGLEEAAELCRANLATEWECTARKVYLGFHCGPDDKDGIQPF